MFSNVVRPMGLPPEPESLRHFWHLTVLQVPKVLKNIEFSRVLELHAQNTLKILVFFYCWSAYGSPLGSVAASTIWEAKKKVKKSRRFATFFSPAGLGLGSGWVGHFKSEGFV